MHLNQALAGPDCVYPPPMRTAPRHASGKYAPALLALILAAGMAVRVWYLDSQLDAERFWDERFNFQNVLALLRTGTLEPVSGYYQLLSYLPQGLLLYASDALHRLTGAAWLEVHDGTRFTAYAYRLSRLVQAVWGVAGVGMTFLIGRRLFSPTVGLVAATAVAFSPWNIHASGVFKPDAPVMLAVLVTFYWSLAADARPSIRSFGLAGTGVALALSTKLTGGLAALPLTVVSVLRGRRQPRRLALLALAGGVALVLFLLLNPYWPIYVEFLEKNFQIYDLKAEEHDMTRWQAPLLTWKWLAGDLGMVMTIAAAIAGVVLVTRLARRQVDCAKRPGVALLLLMPPAWVAGYMALTAQFKFNNFLPILPFVALIGAWGLASAWRWLARRDPEPGRRRLWAAAGALLVILVLVRPGVAYVYRSLTPRAEDLVLRFAERKLAGRRNCLLVYERALSPGPPWEGARADHSCPLWQVGRLTDLDLDQLRLSDGVVFPLARLGGDDAAFYLDAVAASAPRLTSTARTSGLPGPRPGVRSGPPSVVAA